MGNQTRSFGLSTSAFFPTDQSKFASFEIRCLLQNTARWNAARTAIPNFGALVMVSGQIVGSWTNADGRSFPAVSLMELVRLPTNNVAGAGAVVGGGQGGSGGSGAGSASSSLVSPKRSRTNSRFYGEAKSKVGPSTTPLPLPDTGRTTSSPSRHIASGKRAVHGGLSKGSADVHLPSLETMLVASNGKKGGHSNPVDIGDSSSQASSGLSPLTPIDDASMEGASGVLGGGGEEGSDDLLEIIGAQST